MTPLFKMLIPAVFAFSAAAHAQPAQSGAQSPEASAAAAQTAPAKNCRNISAEIRSGKPLTREAVIAEMVRARSEGEMDFYISTLPPAAQRPLCDLPAPQPQ
jgi:hypothetical protein